MILHRKRVLANRPDDASPLHARGLADWNADHDAPPIVAYRVVIINDRQFSVPGQNVPHTEIPELRSKYDFSYVSEARILVGASYGTAKYSMRYSTDGTIWRPLDGISGPIVTQNQPNGTEMIFVSPWVPIETGAKGDRIIAPFYGQNSTVSIIQIQAITLQVR